MIGKQRIALTSVLGLVLGTFGVIYILNLERIQRRALEWFMVLKPNSMMTNLWQSPNLGITADVYIFNWTNSEQYNNPNVKPRFQELGPYSFTERQTKLNVTWHDENSTVSYWRQSRFYFNAEASGGKLTDIVVTPNSVNVGIVHKAQQWNPMMRSLMLLGLNLYSNEPTFTRQADDWLFRGFDTPLLKMSKLIPANMIPDMQFPYERIGFGYPRNSSTEIYGHHNVYTGAKDFSKLGQIARWRYGNVSKSAPHCKLRGTTGEFHPIPLRKGEPITYFLPDICRELQVDYAGTTVYEGIEGYVYRGSKRNVANGTDNPDNKCHCQENCQEVPSGLLNVSSCWYGVPVFVSYPHYYNADPSYVDAVEGIKPDKKRHEMVIILEPTTGMLLDIKATIMVSLLVEPRPESIFRKARRNFLPLIWADYKVRISPDLLLYVKLLPMSMIAGKVLGLLIIALGIVLLLYYPRKMLMKKHFMRKIDISNIENRIQAAASGPELKSKIEGSPLLVGVQYMGSSEHAS